MSEKIALCVEINDYPGKQYAQSPNLDGSSGMEKWKIFL